VNKWQSLKSDRAEITESNMPSYANRETLKEALNQLRATAGTLFRIWLTLKHRGFTKDHPVTVTTSSSDESLVRLFGCGDPSGKLFTPFVSIPSDRFMSGQAGRSIIQTTVRQWLDGSGVHLPSDFLKVSEQGSDNRTKPLVVTATRLYPEGLGYGKSGFAHSEGRRVNVPILALAVWYGRQTEIQDGADPSAFLLDLLRKELHLSSAEEAAAFVTTSFPIFTSNVKLEDSEIYSLVSDDSSSGYVSREVEESRDTYRTRIRTMQTNSTAPRWLLSPPEETLRTLLQSDAKAILLTGPPRTGKTRAIDSHCARTEEKRITIQIHDGWGYDELIQGIRVKENGTLEYKTGILTNAIQSGRKIIVLEEINRTRISQALGEVFSLIEDKYRGEENQIALRDGTSFFIPKDVLFLMTMNTIDKSTEEVDDALLGRFACVDFPARVEDASAMMAANGVTASVIEKICKLFALIQDAYPLGHGYFAQVNNQTDVLLYYKTRVRPVLSNHLRYHKPQELANIDNLVDELFGSR
jgi:5-methylcytosine-specific restriction protein B